MSVLSDDKGIRRRLVDFLKNFLKAVGMDTCVNPAVAVLLSIIGTVCAVIGLPGSGGKVPPDIDPPRVQSPIRQDREVPSATDSPRTQSSTGEDNASNANAEVTPNNDLDPIEVRADGSLVFRRFEGRLFRQDPTVSFGYTHPTALPAAVKLEPGLNYRLQVARNTPDHILIKLINGLSKAPSIIALELSDCAGVTNAVLKALSTSKFIVDIGLCNCIYFDDKGLAYLAKMVQLKQLGLYGDRNIEGEGVKKVLKGCRFLDAIGISGTGLTPELVEELHSEYHNKVKLHHTLIKCNCSK